MSTIDVKRDAIRTLADDIIGIVKQSVCEAREKEFGISVAKSGLPMGMQFNWEDLCKAITEYVAEKKSEEELKTEIWQFYNTLGMPNANQYAQTIIDRINEYRTPEVSFDFSIFAYCFLNNPSLPDVKTCYDELKAQQNQ